MSKLLIDEPPLQVLPTLAIAIGLNEAIVLQQLHYLLRQPAFGRQIAEHKWIFNTVEEWRCRYFPFWSERTIKAAFAELRKLGLVVTCQPEGNVSRRQYYRIDTEKMNQLSEGANSAPSNGQLLPFPITKTTEQRKDKGVSSEPLLSFSSFKPRFPYPNSEQEMEQLLTIHGVEYVPDYDGQFFETMTRAGWTIRGEPIFDWIQTYAARLAVTYPGHR